MTVEVLFEEMRGKFDLVLEGHAALHAKIDEYHRESNEKHDFTAFQVSALKDRIDTVERNLTARIEAVADNLAAHRADTEAHPRYLVRE